MSPARSRPGAFLAALLFLCAPAAAQTVFDVGPPRGRPVYDLPYGPGHPLRHRPALAGKGFRYASSYSLIYQAHAFPGAYTLGFSYPAGAPNLRPMISVFDRWPYDPQARRYDLPMGPLAPTNGRRVECRWSLSISPASASSLLYVAVEVPAGVPDAGAFPHEIYLAGPPSSPMPTMERGVTWLQGPSNLALASEPSFDAEALPSMPIPGDLVRNGSFRDGLNHWTPHRERVAADNVQSFSLSDGVLKLKASGGNVREGVMQAVDADVSGAASLLLEADVMVKEQTQGGLGPEGRDAPVAIAVAYRGAPGGEGDGAVLFWKGFYALDSEDPARDSAGRKVPRGQWYRSMIDLMQLDPKPARILFLSLEGSGWPAREGWVRDVHLIKAGDKK